MKIKIEDLKRDAMYRYLETLCEVFDQAGMLGEAIELALEAVLQADCPSYLPYAAATKTKLLFVLAIYQSQGRMGALMDGIQGVKNMIGLIEEDWRKQGK